MRQYLLLLSFILIGLALGIIACEFYLRTLPQTTLKFYDNDIFGSALVPNQSGFFVTRSKEYKTKVDVNSHGWPDIEHGYEKPEEIYRILILGDSFVENFQVPLENRFFRQLQSKLGNKFEVIAMGRGNTGTSQQYLILKNFGLKYKPDLIVQMFFEANDVNDNYSVLQNATLKKNKNKLKEFLKNFRVIELLLSVRQNIREGKENLKTGYPIDYHVYDKNYSDEYLKAWEVTKKLILETKSEAEKSGARYILFFLPGSEQIDANKQNTIYKTYPQMAHTEIDFEKPDKILLNFCGENNIECYSMLPIFKDFTTYYPRDGHWNQKGTDLATKFLIDILSRYFSII